MDNIITLNSESGEVRFEFLDLVEYNGGEFVVLLPADDPDESGEVVILKLDTIDEDAEEESYIGVEDEDTLQAVFNIFKDKFKDEFDFEDEEDE
jgi:hypothetical protein